MKTFIPVFALLIFTLPIAAQRAAASFFYSCTTILRVALNSPASRV